MAKRSFTRRKTRTLEEVRIKEKKKVIFLGSEAAPFIATGGLADVLGSLPKALANDKNLNVSVILPLYSNISKEFREKTSAEDAEYEFLILGLRTGEGISEEEYRLRFGLDLWEKYGDGVNKYLKSGHMMRIGGRVAFTEEGMRVSNSILVDLTSSGEE
jgi:hypothetical protein